MKKFRKICSFLVVLAMLVTMLPMGQLITSADETVPLFNLTRDDSAVVYNDFEGENNINELSVVNQYNTVVSVKPDAKSNYEGVITTSSGNGVTFSGLWHYGVISPQNAETFDASVYAENGKLSFYVYSENQSRVYVGVKIEDTWTSYKGFTDSNSSTQSAGRTSGRLQDTTVEGQWKKYELELADFDIEDWSQVQGIAIGFYTAGTYYVDNIEFTKKSSVVTTYKYEAEDMQLNNMRFPTTAGVSSRQAVGVYWSNSAAFRDSLEKDSYARVVLEAEEAGNYEISMDYYAGSYPMRIYVNGELQIDETLPGNGWGKATETFVLLLQKGKNVVIFAVAEWGCFDGIYLPSTLRIVENAESENVYRAENALLQATYLQPADSVFDPEAALYTGTLRYDSSDDYISKVIYNVDATEGKSMTIHYYVSEAAKDGSASVACKINDNAKFYIDLDSSTFNTEQEITINANDMIDGGLMDGNNEIEISAASNGGSVGIYSIEFNDDESFVPIEKTTKTGVELKDYITYRGRSLDEGTSVTFDWSGSGFAFNYDGSGDIVATITTSGTSACRIAVYVDDEDRMTNDDDVRVVKSIASGTSKVVLAKNLSEGHHTIEVVKCTEANGSLAQLDALTYKSDGKLSKWKDADYNMLVIGGSVSCGNQIYADGTEDASLSYVANLALAYNMNWNTISCSGRGIIQGYNSEENWAASTKNQLIELNNYTSFFRDKETKWDYTNFTPDIIIINAGGNDLGDAVMEKFGSTVDDFCNAVIEFNRELKRQYPNAMICWFYGVYVNRAHKDEFQAAIDSMNDPSIQLVYTPQMNSGADNHPDVTEHMYVTQIFSERISDYLGIENPLPVYNPNTAPVFETSEPGEHVSVYNDFEGSNRDNEITVENSYNTNLDCVQDSNLNGECLIKLNSSNGNGVNFNDMWHYGIIKPKDRETFDATAYVKNGRLSFYTYSETSSNAYIGIKSGAKWYAYQGFVSMDSSVQTAARSSGRINEEYKAGSWQKFTVNLADFQVEDWSKIEAIGIGFYTCGDYYIDNIQFERDESVEPTEPDEATDEQSTTSDQKENTSNDIVETVTNTANLETTASVLIKPSTTSVVIPKAKISKVGAKKKVSKKLKLTLKKVSSAKKYEIRVYKTRTNAKKNKKAIVKKTVSKLKVTLKSKKLKNKKKLFVRARAFNIVNGKKKFGTWSSIKKVKIKK
ncbi:MAG: hypothetical protein ACLRZ9_03035 [Eubacterium sp.]